MNGQPPRRFNVPEPKLPLWFKVWFAFVAVLGLGFGGLIVWAIVEIVKKVTR